MTEFENPRSFSRRSFVTGAAALTGAGLLAACSPQSQPEQGAEGEEGLAGTGGNEEIYAGACDGNCAGGCYLNIHVRDGKIVRTSARELPDPAYTRICSKGLSQVGRVYSSNRLLYPMKRVGERGSNDFERISWDEALDFIATKWKEITDQYGPGAMAIFNNSGHYSLCREVRTKTWTGVGPAGRAERRFPLPGVLRMWWARRRSVRAWTSAALTASPI